MPEMKLAAILGSRFTMIFINTKEYVCAHEHDHSSVDFASMLLNRNRRRRAGQLISHSAAVSALYLGGVPSTVTTAITVFPVQNGVVIFVVSCYLFFHVLALVEHHHARIKSLC